MNRNVLNMRTNGMNRIVLIMHTFIALYLLCAQFIVLYSLCAQNDICAQYVHKTKCIEMMIDKVIPMTTIVPIAWSKKKKRKENLPLKIRKKY